MQQLFWQVIPVLWGQSALLCASATQCMQNPVYKLFAHSTQHNTELTYGVSSLLLDAEFCIFLSQHLNHQVLCLVSVLSEYTLAELLNWTNQSTETWSMIPTQKKLAIIKTLQLSSQLPHFFKINFIGYI